MGEQPPHVVVWLEGLFGGVLMLRGIGRVVLLWTGLALAATHAIGQEARASLGGKVSDPQKAVVVGADVTVMSVETGVTEKTQTNKSGDWIVRFLVPGHYTFEVTAPGFKTTAHDALELQVGDEKTADVQMQVGGSTEQVEVSDEAPLVDTTAAVSGTVVTEKELESLPTQTHISSLLVSLTPGGLVGAPTGGQAHLWSNTSASTLSVNGLGSVAGSGAGNNDYAVSYVLDGAYDSKADGRQAFIPSQDAVRQFRVSSNAFDASLGRMSGATLTTVTKTGTKDFHGVVYEYNQNDMLNARPYNQPLADVSVNELGGVVDGPVWIPKLYNGRDRKTFFLFNYDYTRNKVPLSGNMSLPTMLERQGDFSQSYYYQNGQKTPFHIYDPTTVDANGNRQEFTGDVIPASRIDPIAKAILALLPAPNTAADAVGPDSNNYRKGSVQDDTFKMAMLRLDQTWSNRQSSYVNLRWNTWSELTNDPFGPASILSGYYQARKNRGVTLDHTILLTQSLVLDLKYNLMNFWSSTSSRAAGSDPTKFGFSSAFAALSSMPSLPLINNGSVSSGALSVGADNSGLGTSQGGNYNNDVFHTMSVSLNQTHGNHSLKYGGEYMIQQQGAGSLGAVNGSFTFGTNWTTPNPLATNSPGLGNGFASFLLGLPTSGSFPLNSTAFWSQHYGAAYIQDDWRVSPRLTLDFGLRWDYETGISERHNKDWTRYDPNYVQTGVTTPSQAAYASEISGTSTNAGIKLLQSYRSDATTFVTRGAIDYAGVHGTPDTPGDPRYKYFQPRLGFAYRAQPTTVLRGGVGRFVQASFNTPSQSGFSQSTNLVATTNNYRESNPATWDNAFSGGLVQPTGNALAEQTNIGTITSYTDPHIGRIYVDEASLSLEQEINKWLIEIGGTYNRSHDLALAYPTNQLTAAQYLAAFSPTFDSTGKPIDLLPGNQTVTNPFKGVAGLPTTSGAFTSNTLTAGQLLRPNPIVNSDIPVTTNGGKASYYGLLTKVEKRYRNGFSFLQSFTWGRNWTQDFFLGNTSLQLYIPRQIYSSDVRFHYSVAPIYELPFGRGKRFLNHSNWAVQELAGGWEMSVVYNFQSGTPIVLPTNSSFYRGDASPNTNLTRGKTGKYFDTSAFVAYPNKATCYTSLRDPNKYPGWTGVSSLPGYGWAPSTCSSNGPNNGVYNDFTVRNTLNPQTFGDIRYPGVNEWTLGARKSFRFTDTVRLQVRFDLFNALNHPQFTSVDTSPTSSYFGTLGDPSSLQQNNAPRAVELGGKLFF